jgi:hypothetical protein
MENVQSTDTLTIALHQGTPQLYNATEQAFVVYKDFAFRNYGFVYLAEVGRFYVAVLSVNHNASYADGRFYQADLERIDDCDRLIFIDKTNQTIHLLRKVELIGRSIDLFSMQTDGERVAFRVYRPYSERPLAYYMVTFFYSQKSQMSSAQFVTLSPAVHFPGGTDAEEVVNFLLGKNGVYLILRNNEAQAWRATTSMTIQDGFIMSHQTQTVNLGIPGGATYLLQGYYLLIDGRIYYVDDQSNVRALNHYGIIKENVDLSDWTNFDLLP